MIQKESLVINNLDFSRVLKDFLVMKSLISQNKNSFPQKEFLALQTYYFNLLLVKHFPITFYDRVRLLFFWNDSFVVSLVLGVFWTALAFIDYLIYYSIELVDSYFTQMFIVFLFGLVINYLKTNQTKNQLIEWSPKNVPMSEQLWLKEEMKIHSAKQVSGLNRINRNVSKTSSNYNKLFAFAKIHSEFNALLINECFQLLLPYLQLYLLDSHKVTVNARLKQVFNSSPFFVSVFCITIILNTGYLAFVVIDYIVFLGV